MQTKLEVDILLYIIIIVVLHMYSTVMDSKMFRKL